MTSYRSVSCCWWWLCDRADHHQPQAPHAAIARRRYGILADLSGGLHADRPARLARPLDRTGCWISGSAAVVCTAVAFMVMFALVAEAGPARMTLITYVNCVAILLGAIVLDEPLTIGLAIGFPLVIIGSVLGTWRNTHHRPTRRVPVPTRSLKLAIRGRAETSAASRRRTSVECPSDPLLAVQGGNVESQRRSSKVVGSPIELAYAGSDPLLPTSRSTDG